MLTSEVVEMFNAVFKFNFSQRHFLHIIFLQ
jgi:hypothetical protein